ncbi:tRNA(His) guanylyltransferase 2-like isoform X1 [Hibiscus syriacus]|uniref:tRNA(His) guanylyltransferase 2-like isoform X1 n=1 Tax=Hibiscus syriacus TaxID=106335 RepID=A0A6A2XY66_HIBSY|nr:violaxanthin de-epoxidase, chloroplastic [Hibiscus syriacus]KAE8663659.1 tRNA(His) guanylyltransferase 2-like isoform X1 [Hibiscus syriacus]
MSLVLEPPRPPQPKSAAPLKRRFASIRTALAPTNHQLRPSRFRFYPTFSSRPTVTAVLKSEKEKTVVTQKKDPPVRIVAVVGDESVSPLKCATWEEVMLHTAKRMKWVDEGYEMVVFTDNFHQSNDGQTAMDLQKELACADILLVVAVTNQDSVNWIRSYSESIPNIICFESDPGLVNKLGGSYVHSETKSSVFDKTVGISQLKKTKEVVQTVSEAWDRHNSDDIRFCLLVIINAYIRPVPVLKNLRSKGFSTLNCMVKNCGPQILDCLMDPNCRKALQCLNKCSPVDQVCNYRCIASYESPKLEAFSLCVLQKNNCLDLDSKIPEKPYVQPMLKFRGKDLCHETAEDMFVGWLGSLDWSWRVVAGQNPAYDQFPCQYQLFYRGKAKGSFWYEPVFQVKTLEGEMIWRRRKYRVKRANVPGTFYFSVLDNGVVSNEFWTIVDVCEDFSWGLFHYHGAARVAGQSYTGAVLVSPDGAYPKQTQASRLSTALGKCGIKEWELYTVDNCSCQDPPLGIPQGSSLHSVVDVKDQSWALV